MKKVKFNWKSFGRKLKTGWSKNNQMVLAVIAGTCAIAAVVDAVRKSKKVIEITEERRDKLDDLTEELRDEVITRDEFRKKQFEVNCMSAKEYALCYGSTLCLLLLSVGSTACNYKISIGKQAALLGAYKALELKSSEFSDKVKDLVGEKKFNEIKTAVTKDNIARTEIPEDIKAPEYEKDADGNFLTKAYMYPCWEDQTGRPFMSSSSSISMAMSKAAVYCFNNGRISLNKICEFLDPNGVYLPPCTYGEMFGFRDSDLVSNYCSKDPDPAKNVALPYYTRPIEVDGFDHSFTALIFDKNPANLTVDESHG